MPFVPRNIDIKLLTKYILLENIDMKLPDYISQIKYYNILQASKIWNNESRKSESSRQDFLIELKAFGWESIETNACFKVCVAKDSIIAKYAKLPNNDESINEMDREFQQWKLAPWQFRKHLPIVYSFYKGLMIQDRVLVKCHKNEYCKDVIEIYEIFLPHLYDYGHNHGHTIKGTVKFFDWVYNRTGNKIEDKHIKFLD